MCIRDRPDRERVRTLRWAAARDDDRILTDDPAPDDPADGHSRHTRVRMRRGVTIFIACTAVIAMTPFVADNYVVRSCTFLCMYAGLALSWNVIGGYAGYPSFSTAGFFGLGAYAGALLQHAGMNLVLSWLGATVVVAVLAASIGRFIRRMKPVSYTHLRAHE